MAELEIQPVIFTDLDGTLLDHHSYSPFPADDYVRKLHKAGIPVIPITSKTKAETENLMGSLAGSAVSSTENGAMIHAPPAFFESPHDISGSLALDIGWSEIRAALNQLPADLRRLIQGFSDMSVAEVAGATGLSMEDSKRAKAREASEPFSWSGNDTQLAQLETLIQSSGLRIQRGGRFFHLTGQADKADAMRWLMARFQEKMPNRKIVSIALGDGPNDLAMIEAADYGVIIPNPSGSGIRSDKPSMITAPQPGPRGWIDAVQQILTSLDAPQRSP